jgi:DNA-binding CsgD family transcriptional regulator
MQSGQFNLIGELVERLGTSGFDDYFFRFYDEVLGIAHCTVFEYIGDEQARIILAVDSSSGAGSAARSLAYDYVNGFFQKDPYLQELMNSEDSENPRWKTGDPDRIEDTEYREKFYDKPDLVHELILQFKDDQHSIIATLYRNDAQGPFTASDKENASLYVGLSLKLLNKHIELLDPDSENNAEERRKPDERVQELLLQQGLLSPREAKICSMILVGYTTRGISLNLDITMNTVATHRKRAYRKLGIGTQNELFCRCFEVLYKGTPSI